MRHQRTASAGSGATEQARLVARAREQYRAGNLAAAGKHLQKAIKFNTRDPRPHLLLAQIQQQTGRLQESIQSYKNCLRHNPDNIEALINLGMLYKRRGRVDTAIEYYSRALELRQDIPELYNNLGNARLDKGEHEEAVKAYRQALDLNADFAGAWHNLGRLYLQLNQTQQALPPLRRARQLQPGSEQIINDLALCLGLLPLDETDNELGEDLSACLAIPRIDGRALGRAACRYLRYQVLPDIIEAFRAGQLTVSEDTLERLQHPLLLTVLQREPLCDPELESLLTCARKACLLADETVSIPPLLASLAEQCFINEYLWEVSDAETRALLQLERDLAASCPEGSDLTHWYLYACYAPLSNLLTMQKAEALLQTAEEPFARLLRQQILEPAAEADLKQELPVLTAIDHVTSQAVREQYEANPYPRWRQIDQPESRTLTDYLCQLFPVLRRQPPEFPARPQILCAGCGTGLQALRMARRIQGAEILAIDISSASLAYGLRQARSAGHAHIRFAQADILNLDDSAGRFDCIECYGVLHHLSDPETGWQKLRRLLKPGGVMRIGLYSHTARGPIRRIREVINRHGFHPDREGIRSIRRHIARLPASDPCRRLIHSPDFYTVSECRDLMFHVQEQQLNLQDIAAILQRLQLQFLGFEFEDYAVLGAYRGMFPDDPAGADLNHWHEYENLHPDSFAAQYIFWVQTP